jgi:hypothetical protein
LSVVTNNSNMGRLNAQLNLKALCQVENSEAKRKIYYKTIEAQNQEFLQT